MPYVSDDFQPASVDVTKMAAVEVQENSSVTVTVPHVEVKSPYFSNPVPISMV